MSNKFIINADDYGLTESCTKAIADAFKRGLISSTTACANGAYIAEGLTLAKENGFADKIGIHINLTEGKPLTDKIANDSFFCEDGKFHGKINRLKKPTKEQLLAVKEEVSAQIERLISLGYEITHADSHHHSHTCIFLFDAIKEVLLSFGIKKLRIHRNCGKIPFYKKILKNWFNKKLKKQGFIVCPYFGSVEDYAENKDLNAVCEVMVHPDYNENGLLIDRVEQTENGNLGEQLKNALVFTAGQEKISYRELK